MFHSAVNTSFMSMFLKRIFKNMFLKDNSGGCFWSYFQQKASQDFSDLQTINKIDPETGKLKII